MLIDIGLQKKDRKTICDALSRILADTFILYLKVRNYHWNVVSSKFMLLHELFEKDYEELSEMGDMIAERIRALGYPAAGSYGEYINITVIKEEKGSPDAQDMLRQLVLDHELIVRRCLDTRQVADTFSDVVTVDMLVRVIESHSKWSWFYRSHLDHRV